MNPTVSFHLRAEDELNDAAEYYRRASPVLAATFLDEVVRVIHEILEFPEASPDVGGGVLRRLLRRFPYGVLYTIRGREIRGLAIMNLCRRPMFWGGRS